MTAPEVTIRVVQLSDTHFSGDSTELEGGFGYDTGDAFEAVLESIGRHDPADLVAVTGDIADHGRADQYHQAAEAFTRLSAPVNVCPGNHDQDLAFRATLGRPTVGTSRVIEAGRWCFLFADSNAGVMVQGEAGRHVDPPRYEDRLHRNGSLGPREMAWITDMCKTTTADHVFVWVHHPPAAPVGLTSDADYDAEWTSLMTGLPKVRGVGGGHTHVPDRYQFGEVPVFVCPALKHNFDLEANTLLPPGYRTYSFEADGSVTSTVHLVEDDRWPRRPLGRAVVALLNGELTHQQFDEILARKQR